MESLLQIREICGGNVMEITPGYKAGDFVSNPGPGKNVFHLKLQSCLWSVILRSSFKFTDSNAIFAKFEELYQLMSKDTIFC